jgi:hypothetical protein
MLFLFKLDLYFINFLELPCLARPNFQLLLLAIFLRLLSPSPIYFPLAAEQVEFFFDAAAS